MFFCENCGSKLPSDARFCENCGYAISYGVETRAPSVSVGKNVSLFTSKEWTSSWRDLVYGGEYRDYGLIFTNTSNCPDNLKKNFYDVLNQYIAYKADEGVCYCVLDMAEQSVKKDFFGKNATGVEFGVKALKEIYEVAPPKYVLIIGDRNSVDSIKWKNPIYSDDENGDSDRIVDSDLPYTTLDTTSPFESGPQVFKLSVGRIPSSAGNGFPEAITYLKNAMEYNCRGVSLDPFALSAIEWAKVSRANFDDITPELYSCPPSSFVERMRQYNLNILPRDETFNLYCFNLHGGPTHHYWLSGDGHLAYSPECLPNHENVKYVMCTESCYGAKPVIVAGDGQSTLMTALANRCLGFVGSTQIAYGITDYWYEKGYQPMGADVLIGNFASGVGFGMSLGEAYMEALSETVAGRTSMNAEDIKTLASFALYGDPSLHLLEDDCYKSKSRPASKKSFHIPMPDVRKAVNMKLTTVSSKISAKVSDYIAKSYKDSSNIVTKYYAVSGYDGYKATSKQINGHTTGILSIYVSKNGDVDSVYVSK